MKSLPFDPGKFEITDYRRIFDDASISSLDRAQSYPVEIVEHQKDRDYRVWYNSTKADYPLHTHSDIEIVLCMKSGYKITINDTSYNITKGDILFIPSSCVHSVESIGKRAAMFVFLFDLSIVSFLHTGDIGNSLLSRPIHLSSDRDAEKYNLIYSSFFYIITQYFSDGAMSEFAVISALLSIICTLGNNPGQPLTPSVRKIEGYDRFATLLSYIDAHCNENLTLDKISSRAGFSKYHFDRVFKKYTGITYYEYLSSKRIYNAKELLEAGMPISEIAAKTGFKSLTSFSRAFKKNTGISPSEYRLQSKK